MITIGFNGSKLALADASSILPYLLDFRLRGLHSQVYEVGLCVCRLICDHQGRSLDLVPNPRGGIIASINFVS